MRVVFALFVALHGFVHLLGAAKAFGWVELPQLRAAISAGAGIVWLTAAVLLVTAAGGVVAGARWWWCPALAGALVSQALVMTVWSDAKFGTVANLVVAVPLCILALDLRASSFRSQFADESALLLLRDAHEATLVTEADIASLPSLMQVYLRGVGAVGRPHVRNFRVQFTAEMRSSATAPWMKSTATQYEFFNPPARLFYMNATRSGVPFDVLHKYTGNAATFRVRIAGIYPMVNKSGPGVTHDETVTLMNDILVLAPAAVLDLPFTFEVTGQRSLRASIHNAGYTVAANLAFNVAGDLVGFISSDRAHDREGGAASWSTPISEYRVVDGNRVGTRGDANWIEPTGEWTYGRFTLTSIGYNVSR